MDGPPKVRNTRSYVRDESSLFSSCREFVIANVEVMEEIQVRSCFTGSFGSSFTVRIVSVSTFQFL